jgi:thiamine-phosphate pyrophosphorylase
MKNPFGLYLILTDPIAGYTACAEAAVECGVRYLQLRMKNATFADALETAKKLRQITINSATRFIINDDLALAMECDADGLHLGQDDQSIAEARARWNRPEKVLGLSTHSMAQAVQAVEQRPDYIGIGPVFPTATKKNHDPALGIIETARIAARVPLESVAIGGISAGNLPALLEAGIGNYCVVSAVNAASQPAAAIRTLQEIHARHVF